VNNNNLIEDFRLLLQDVMRTAVTMGLFVLVLWIIYFLDSALLHSRLRRRYGIRPRSRFSLLSIFISPFLHVNRQHLAANSVPFFVLGSLVMVQGQPVFWLTTAVIIPIAGLGIWFFGKPNTQHMGASGLILGYFGFTMSSVFFSPDLATILVAIVVAVLYLGLIWQIVPMREGVSTTGHLFGFLGGVVAAGLAALLGTVG
jgi:membrane associated rhomboid family serine protease